MKKIFFSVIFALATFIVFAQSLDQYPGLIDALRDAATESDEGTRLALYDAIAQKFGFTETAISGMDVVNSKWISDKKTDPLSDKMQYSFFLEADSGSNEYGYKPFLVIRYSEEETELYINWDTYLGNDTDNYKYDSKYVTIRIDSAPPSTTLWGNSTDDKASFCPWEDALDLVRKIAQGAKLVARCTPYGDNPITAVFDIRGFKDISMPYSEATGWWK